MSNPTDTFPNTATPIYVDFDAWDTLRIIFDNLKGWTVNIDGKDVTLAGTDGDNILVYDGKGIREEDAKSSGLSPRRITSVGRVYIY